MSRHADSLEALPTHQAEVEASPRSVPAVAQSAEEEIKGKVRALVARHGGDIRTVFDAYDRDGDGSIDGGELTSFLKDSGIGNRLTRGMYASAIISYGDQNGDGKIDFYELIHMSAGWMP
ncbi:MAG: EF-hand domain-containing protein [Kofleriaceae bacterium]|jgi:hypothetical protein|nr:EF-hand domain-containing protein [Kofleriaceae bacterium]MBP9202786.1 EF-hand domain-containing protein [Kofleriaceae bacterium]